MCADIAYKTDIVTIDAEFCRCLFPKRKSQSNKGTYGHVTVIGGCKNYVGAPLFAARSASEVCALLADTAMCGMLSGAGTSAVALPDFLASALYPSVRYSAVEPLTSDGTRIVYDEEETQRLLIRTSAFCIGTGAGEGETDKIVRHILLRSDRRMVIDADALVRCRDFDFAHRAVLTPHLGEMARMLGTSVADVEKNAPDVCREYSAAHSCVTVLKSDVSYISDGERVLKNVSGNAKLAKGGSGDVLSGIIAGLLAQGKDSLDAAAAGSYLLGRAAELSAVNEYSHLPTDIINMLPNAIGELVY